MPKYYGADVAAGALSQAIGDVFKGLLGAQQQSGVEEERQAKLGQSRRQEMLSQAMLPLQIAQEQANLSKTRMAIESMPLDMQTKRVLLSQAEEQLRQSKLPKYSVAGGSIVRQAPGEMPTAAGEAPGMEAYKRAISGIAADPRTPPWIRPFVQHLPPEMFSEFMLKAAPALAKDPQMEKMQATVLKLQADAALAQARAAALSEGGMTSAQVAQNLERIRTLAKNEVSLYYDRLMDRGLLGDTIEEQSRNARWLVDKSAYDTAKEWVERGILPAKAIPKDPGPAPDKLKGASKEGGIGAFFKRMMTGWGGGAAPPTLSPAQEADAYLKGK